MRNGQHQHHNKRMRGRNNNHNNNNNNNHRRNHNPLTRVYESNGPDVKIRGTANHVAEKYLQLARDAQSSGDLISSENYFQHAEHYFRLIAAAQEQFRQNNPSYQPRPEGGGEQFAQRSEENYEDGDDTQPSFGGEAPFGTREPQPYIPPNAQPFVQRDNQPYQPREANQPHENRHQQSQPQPRQPIGEPGNHESLPAFITGGAPVQPQQANGPNGHDNQGDRFPLHRRRRRHRGPRGDFPPGGPASDNTDDGGPGSGNV
jgi:Domain of unknown function (DUF4167)